MADPLRDGFRVGKWQVAPSAGQIDGPGGSLHLEPKVMDVLVCLAGNAGEVTERDLLLKEVWGERALSDEPLTRCIAALRKALGDDPQSPTYIQTVPKRGYRLVADVTIDSAKQPGEPRSPSRTGAILTIAVVIAMIAAVVLWQRLVVMPDPDSQEASPVVSQIPVTSVVVFPFEGQQDGVKSTLGRSFSADIVRLLSRVDGLRSKSLLYVDSLLGQGLSPIEICEQLDASHLLQGRIDADEERLKLSLELIDARNGDVAWSETYVDEISSLIKVQYSVVDNVARGVGIAPLEIPSDSIREIDPDAFQLYVEAKSISDPMRGDEIIDLLNRAIEIDDTYAEAHTLLALQYMVLGWASEDRFGPFLDSAVSHASRAVQIDPALVEPRLILANVHALRYEWVEARRLLDEVEIGEVPDAVSAAPIVINFGEIEQAIEISREMYEENPGGGGLTFLTVYYSIAGQFDRALQAAEVAESSGQIADVSRLGVYHAKNGNVELAETMFSMFLPIWRFDPALAGPYARSVAAGTPVPEFREALDNADKALDANSIFFHVYIGSPADQVFALANRLYDDRRLNIIALYEPWAAELRSDPRFVDLVTRMGLADYWREYGPPDFCTFIDDVLSCS